MDSNTIDKINQLIADYFQHSTEDWIPAKDMMPIFIKAGVFTKDEKNGLPFRKVLRALDKANELHKIPTVHAERKEENTYWYLVREGATFTPKETLTVSTKKTKDHNDEYYLVHLCNELLGETAYHQFTFEDLVGDEHKKNRKTTNLPLDAFYPELNLVIEFLEEERPINPKKPQRLTVSGVPRAQQRKIYQKRKQLYLKENEINLVEIKYSLFEQDKHKNLIRNREADLEILQKVLKKYIK